ncbi:TPA: hypothetical protein N0F65_009303 [Lagenidium giganteum]|uniref:Magnesium transporter n=1 Tax=Lagenidium giganteum TaxID=4803 RepID=A0AAV2YMY7_9STRA|nr:TPA: hypothetical protein N0F65_009303 [Lagenidium giganteum]
MAGRKSDLDCRDVTVSPGPAVVARGASAHPPTAMTCEQKDDNPLWYVGVIVGILGSVCTNMGVNLQKFSFMREAKKSIKAKRPYVRQPLWVIGLLLVISGSGLDFLALGFLPQSLAIPVGGSTMVANVVFASLFLKEKFSRLDAMGTSLVMGGICVVAAFANKESDCYTVTELVHLYSEPLFIMYVVVMICSCLALYASTKYLEKVLRLHGSSSTVYKRFARLHPVCYPALSGVFGAQSVLFAKSVAELIKTTAHGENQFVNFGTYAIAFSMFACIFLQIHWLAHGLQSFDAVFIVPVFQCFFISISIFGGGVYFNEFATMSSLALGMFFTGVAVTLSGVYLLSKREMNVLRPSGKFRAVVKMVIFIKRTQKAKNMEYRWVIPPTKAADGTPDKLSRESESATLPPSVPKGNVVLASTAMQSPAKHGKLSKAAVMPIDTHSLREKTITLDTSTSQIEMTPKRMDK